MATKRPFSAPPGISIPSTGILNLTNLLASTASTNGSLTVAGGVGIGGSISLAGRLQIFNGSNFTAFQSSASDNTVYILPATAPAIGSSVLQSTSAGVLSWVPIVATGDGGSGSGLSTLNTLTSGIQFFSAGTSGNTFNISSFGSTHTFNIPIAGSGATGLVSTQSQTFAGQKTFTSSIIGDLTGTATTATYAHQSGYATTSGSSGTATTAQNINIANASTNSAHPLHFSPSATGTGLATSSNTTLSFNPSSNILSVSGLAVTAGTTSTSSSTGALTVSGGVGIGGTLYVATAIGVNTGSSGLLLQKLVGGNYGAIYSSGIVPSATNYTMITDGAAVNFNGTGGVYFNISNTNKIQVTTNNINIVPTAVSTSSSTGAFTVAGGVGIGGSLYVASATGISGVFINNGTVTGNLTGTASTATYSLQSGYGITAGTASTSTYSLQSGYGITAGTATTSNYSLQSGYGVTAGLATTSVYSHQAGYAITSGSSGIATTATYANQSGYGITAGTASTSTYSLQSGYGITSGTATTAQNINVIAANTNSNHLLLFTPTSGSASGLAVSSNSTLVYNPSTEILSVSGLAVTSGILTTSSSSGSLIVTGGVGIGSSLNVLGRVGVGTNLHSAQINVRNSSSSTTGIIVQGATSQSADYLQILSSSGTTTFSINSSGRLSWPSSSVAQIYNTSYSSQGRIVVSGNLYVNPGPFIVDTGAGEASMTSTSITFGGVGWGSYGSPARVSTDNAVRIQPTSTSVVPLVVQLQNASWTSGNAFEIQNNSALRFNVDYAGNTVLLSSTAATNSSSGALVVTGGVGIGGSLFVAGDLTINGTTTTINSVTLTVDDKNIELGSVTSPSDITAEGGGITLKGLTDKFINWYTGTGWSSSESWNLISGNTYKINNTTVISTSSIGTGITNSSLTALGTITTGVWSGTAITPLYGGTGLQPTFTVGDILYANSSTTWNRLTPGTNGFVLTSAGTANTPTYTNPSNLSVGLATTSSNSRIASAGNSNSVHLILFTPASSTSGAAISSDTTFSFNPSTEILSVSGLAVTSSTNSTSTTSGAVQIRGGVGITGAVYIGESVNATSLTQSTNTTTGSLVVSGGAGISGALNIGGASRIFSSTASTNTSTGALLVAGGVGISGQLSFVTASLGFTGVTTNPTMSFIGATSSSPITLTVQTDNSLNWEGSSGSLFSIDNNLSSGEIFAVSDISGLPIISASAGQTVNINEFGGYTQIGNGTINSSTTSNGSLVIAGGLGMTGNANIGGTVRISSGTNSASTSSGSLVVLGGLGITGNAFIGGTTTISNGTNSTSTTTGSLVVLGGLGITGNTFIGGTTTVSNGTNSNSTTSGSLVVLGGLGITGNAFIGGTTTVSNGTNSGSSTSGSLVVLGGLGITGNAFIGGTTTVTSGTNSGSSTSGSLVVLGGLGITGNAFIGGTTTINGGTNSFSTATGALVVNGGLGVTGNANIGGTTRISSTVPSTSSTTGALSVAGGVGIGQTLFVGTNLAVSNNSYFGSNTFSKSGSGAGDVYLDNGGSDTPGVLFYHGNNRNIGIDLFYSGTGNTRFRITRDLNEATGSELWSVDRNGIVLRSNWDVGEVIASRVYNNSDLGMSATTTINSTTYTNVAVITYTPKSSTSHLWIEFDANYDYSNGTTTDDFFSRITVAGSVISERNQIMVGQVGGGTRSGVIFPISGRYTNSSTSGIAITVQARWGSADDAIRVYGSSTSGYMRIQEIGR